MLLLLLLLRCLVVVVENTVDVVEVVVGFLADFGFEFFFFSFADGDDGFQDDCFNQIQICLKILVVDLQTERERERKKYTSIQLLMDLGHSWQ